MRLPHDFFNRPTLDVAQDLLGKTLVVGAHSGIINETEAYNQEDPASHAFNGRKSARNETMFRRAGHLYVYFIYGVHYCANIVTEDEGRGCAVLLRGVVGINGPGRLCKAFGLNKSHNGIDLTDRNSPIYIEDRGHTFSSIKTTPRIGISKAESLHWRFIGTNP